MTSTVEETMQSSRGTLFVDPWEITAMKDAPELNDGEDYHIFISYSNTDSDWARALIQELESAIPNLKACYHERDFLPGKTIVENMSTAIQRSQKVLLVLSRDFVRSRWCQMEANLSVFQESMHQKPVIPLMREHCSIPLHLTHLTYLDTKDKDFFAKIVSVICSSNHSMKNATLVPYQPVTLYNGKHLVCLPALNKHHLLIYHGSMFSEIIPDVLRSICDNDNVYSKAVHIINEASSRSFKWKCVTGGLAGFVSGAFGVMFLVVSAFLISNPRTFSHVVGYILLGASVAQFGVVVSIIVHFMHVVGKERFKKISLAAGLANTLLEKSSILVGCESRLKLHFVYFSLAKCKAKFTEAFNGDQQLTEEMFQRALYYYSSSYTWCVVQKHFPFAFSSMKEGHMGSVPCLCQYVSYCLQEDATLC